MDAFFNIALYSIEIGFFGTCGTLIAVYTLGYILGFLEDEIFI